MKPQLSPFEVKTLQLLQRCGKDSLLASAVGYVLWEQCDPGERKSNPSRQGLALFAGRFLGALNRRQLVRPGLRGWTITAAGRAALEAETIDTRQIPLVQPLTESSYAP